MYITTVKGGENTQKNIQKRILLITLTILFTLTIIGAAAAAVDSNVTSGTTNADGITKTVTNLDGSNSTINVGDRVNYTITAKFHEVGPAEYRVNDVLPAGLEYISSSATQGTYDNNTGRWNTGWLGWGIINPSSATLNIIARVTTPGIQINNTARLQMLHWSFTQGDHWDNDGLAWTNFYVPTANVVMTKTANGNVANANVNVGQTGTFTIRVTNNGPDTAQNVRVSDPLPPGFTAGTPTQGTYAGGVWNIGTLANGASVTLTFTRVMTAADAGTTKTNTATETQNTYDPSPVTGQTATIYVPYANVVMTKTANGNVANANVNVGQTGTFTITITNNGPDAAQNVRVSDPLLTGFTAGIPTLGSYVGGVWTIPSLANGTSATLTFSKVMTAADAGATISNTATETQDTYDPSPVTGQTATIHIPIANMVITKTSNGPLNVGQIGTFTIVIVNGGPEIAHNVVVIDNLPSGFTADAPSQGSFVGNTWTVGDIGYPGSATLIIRGLITPAMAGTTIWNTVTETQDEYSQLTNTATSSIYVPYANVTVTKTSNGPVNVGQTGTFTITLHNSGPNTAHNIVVTDLIPSGFTAGAPSQGSFVGNTWTVGDLASGGDASLTISGVITTAMAGTTIWNTVTEVQDEYNFLSNTATSSIYVPDAAHVTVTKTANNYTPNYWDLVTFTITAHNDGPNTATGLEISDFLPVGLTFVSANTHGFGTFNSGIWSIPSLANGTDAILTLVANVTGTGTITNWANVTAQTTYDYLPWCNTSAILNVPPAATIDVEKWFMDYQGVTNITSADYHDYVAMIISATNNGPNTCSVIISDIAHGLIPTTWSNGDLYYISFNGGTWNPNTMYPGLWDGTNWTLTNIPAGDNWRLAIFGIVNATDTSPNGPVYNTATVTSQNIYDPENPTADPNGYDTDTANLQVNSAADVAITKEFRTDYLNSTSTTNTANYHTPIWVLVHVTNNGPDSAVNLQVTDILPVGLTYQNLYHVSHDNGTTWSAADVFNSGIWTIGDMLNGNDYWLAILAQVDGHNTTVENVANKTQTTFDWNDTNNEGRATLNIPPAADVFVKTTISKNNPTVGENVVVRVKVGNNGPDGAQNVVVTYKLPAGMEFVSLTQEAGYPAPTYDPATRTVTWNLGDLGIIDPWMDITLRAVGAGTTSSDASVTSDTYDPVPTNNVEAVTITVEQVKVQAATVPMQPTGVPIAGLILAVLAVFAGLVMPKRK